MNLIIQKLFMEQPRFGNNGYVALLSVLVLGMVGLTLVLAMAVFGTDSIRGAATWENSAKARALANACAEEALQEIKDNDNYFGEGNISLMNGDCNYTVIIQTGESREIRSEGVVDNTTRRLKVLISGLNPAIIIDSWEELPSF